MIRETYILFIRSLITSIKNPIWLFITLFQPLLYLFLFAPLLKGLGNLPGFPPNSTLNIFVPGLLVMLALFGSAFVGFGLVGIIRAGTIERFLVTPASRVAILLGMVLRDVLILIIQASILTIIAIPMGLKFNFSGFLLAIGLIIFIAITMASFSYALAITFKSEDTLASLVNIFTAPILLLSGITLPLTLAPLWLRNVANFNPFYYAVSGMRSLFFGTLSDSSVIKAYIILAIMAILMFMWAYRALRNMAA